MSTGVTFATAPALPRVRLPDREIEPSLPPAAEMKKWLRRTGLVLEKQHLKLGQYEIQSLLAVGAVDFAFGILRCRFLGLTRLSYGPLSVGSRSCTCTRLGCWFSSIVPQWASDDAQRSEQMAREKKTLA